MEAISVQEADARPGAPADPAIALEGVSKAFHVRRGSDDAIRAVDDVTLTVPRGEFLGVVGRNGSGKSTLLKCIAEIYAVDAGTVAVAGRVSPFLELGGGFSPDLSARDNVMISGTILGLSRAQVRARLDSILAFAELEEFADMPLKSFSSGMKVRLAFSIAIQVDADVLLFDEVLAVGDASFRDKCFAEFERLKGEKTIVLVTHSMPMVERFCDRAVLLEGGRMVAAGEPEAVARRYLELNEAPPPRRIGSAPVRRDRPRPPAPARRRSAREGWEEARRFLELSATLAQTTIKLRFAGSRLGLLWSVLRPLLLFGVLYAVFTHVVRFGGRVPHYEVYLLTSIVLWTCFSDAAGGAVGSLVARASILRKLRFPRLAVPFSVVLVALFDLGANLIVLFGFVIATGVEPHLGWLELIPVIVLLGLLATGAAILLSALFVRRRDVGPIWSVLQRGLFYGSAVLYPVAAFPDSVERAMVANPIVPLLTQARHGLLGQETPTAASIGGPALLLAPLAVTAAILALGLWVFRRESPRLTENL